MWEQGAEHQAEMLKMEEMVQIRVKEAREEGVRVGISQQSGLTESLEDEEPSSPQGSGILSELFSFGRSGESGVVAELNQKLEALEAEMDSKDLDLENFQADREYYESQLLQGKADLQQAQLKGRELGEELAEVRNGAASKKQEREIRDLERTLSYVKKHMFHLFKSVGQERVREYMKEVFAGNWRLDAPVELKNKHNSDSHLQREVVALNHRCEELQMQTSEKEEEMRALAKELRYAEQELGKERQRVRRAEEILVNMSSKKEKKKSLWKNLTN
eukprot:TRINITY_DN14191_c0_g1_i8.p1 TRINITY_DN14191_c0_g1~~TRINITY_DN14191_c0_g1_i8.p1  ORF type:complete len:275 (+),score=68.93 TRINITY_DN14191_c0_g1_i8:627-1451(+)